MRYRLSFALTACKGQGGWQTRLSVQRLCVPHPSRFLRRVRVLTFSINIGAKILCN